MALIRCTLGPRTLAMDVGGSIADVVLVSTDLECGDLGSGSAELKAVNDEEVYLDALVMVSLRLLRKGLPLVIRNLGVRLLQLVLELLIENSTCCKVGAMVEARGSSILKNEFCSHAGPWRDEAGPEMVDEELHSSCVDDDISGLGSKEHVDDCYH
ncbi:uncharacterized protein LOC133908977 isoform X2 [Phragmites australis]|uniref:uncharacterized protein LOC133908977 isoform X2 n=1 Tax=Phragmites australis TaxID=29695 RepID=UPI002D78A8D3|nr:uncharacterized protein LOC133908977 isoform X2 [Phragmites australis]